MSFGLPKIITSDQGGEFNNKLEKYMMEKLGINHCLTTPYHPQVLIALPFAKKYCNLKIGKWS